MKYCSPLIKRAGKYFPIQAAAREYRVEPKKGKQREKDMK
jgi:hypothetical protein